MGRWVVVGAVAAMVGCATPYQSMGFSGGYQSEQMAEGQYFVEVQVNAYTSRGTALRYLHRRARELCTGAGYRGYTILDRVSEEKVSYYVQRNSKGGSVESYSKPGVSALVQCTGRPEPIAMPASAPRMPQTDDLSEDERSFDWHCTSHLTQSDLGLCLPSRGACEAAQAKLAATEPYVPCEPASTMFCFRYLANDERLSCHPTATTCGALRALKAKQLGEAPVMKCRPTE